MPGYLFNKADYIQTIEADLYTCTKKGVFVDKRYAADGMFKLNVDGNKIVSPPPPPPYMVYSFNV